MGQEFRDNRGEEKKMEVRERTEVQSEMCGHPTLKKACAGLERNLSGRILL